jgi:hypothetical protein
MGAFMSPANVRGITVHAPSPAVVNVSFQVCVTDHHAGDMGRLEPIDACMIVEGVPGPRLDRDDVARSNLGHGEMARPKYPQ